MLVATSPGLGNRSRSAMARLCHRPAADERPGQGVHGCPQPIVRAGCDQLEIEGAVHEKEGVLGPVGELGEIQHGCVGAALGAEHRIGVLERSHVVDEHLDPEVRLAREGEALAIQADEPGGEIQLGLAVDLVGEGFAVEAFGRCEQRHPLGQRQDRFRRRRRGGQPLRPVGCTLQEIDHRRVEAGLHHRHPGGDDGERRQNAEGDDGLAAGVCFRA